MNCYYQITKEVENISKDNYVTFKNLTLEVKEFKVNDCIVLKQSETNKLSTDLIIHNDNNNEYEFSGYYFIEPFNLVYPKSTFKALNTPLSDTNPDPFYGYFYL